ncbi:MAG: hypothetical protein LBH68_02920, partial [Bifidobacteriaceae bacterium]|nr:hypothetical protein [Bifidobacteriaceae bacterium]
ARCIEGLGLNLVALDPFPDPVDGTLAGQSWDWNGEGTKPDPNSPEFGDKVNSCYDDFSLDLLTWGFKASSGQAEGKD